MRELLAGPPGVATRPAAEAFPQRAVHLASVLNEWLFRHAVPVRDVPV